MYGPLPASTAAGMMLLAATGCNGSGIGLCDDFACEAAYQPATDVSIRSGIAGVATDVGDVITDDDCLACGFDPSGELWVWLTPELVRSSEEALAVMESRQADHALTIPARYELALDPGNVLVCNGVTMCIALAIDDGTVFTVNVVFHIDGGHLVAFAPGSSVPLSHGGIELPRFPNSPPP